MSTVIKTDAAICSIAKSGLREGVAQYSITERTRDTEEGEILEYGILQFIIMDSEISKLAQINGISPELKIVEELVSRLYESDVEPCSLFEIVEDFVNEKAMI